MDKHPYQTTVAGQTHCASHMATQCPDRPASWSCSDPSHIGPEYAPEYAPPVVVGPCADCARPPVPTCASLGSLPDPVGAVACQYEAGHSGDHGAIVAGAWPTWTRQS